MFLLQPFGFQARLNAVGAAAYVRYRIWPGRKVASWTCRKPLSRKEKAQMTHNGTSRSVIFAVSVLILYALQT
jgi:hypothetical protein